MAKGSIVKGNVVRWENHPRAAGDTAAVDSSGKREARIDLKRQGNLIEALEITCRCGHQMVFECLYDAVETDGFPGGE